MTQLSSQLDYLAQLARFSPIKPGLANMRKLLTALNNPHQQFPSIHIAGTNGKSSTAAIIANVLKEADYQTGLYTSPHLIRFNERIQINNQPLTNSHLARHIAGIRQTAASIHLQPTFFEFTTALAFDYFARRQIDLAIIEVGMGGDLDATNVITPLLSIITNIGIDHQAWLGRTKAAIAKHKAGIIKPGIPLITAETDPHILDLLHHACRRQSSEFISVHHQLRAKTLNTSLSGQTFSVQTINHPQNSPPPTPNHPIQTPDVEKQSTGHLPPILTPGVKMTSTELLNAKFSLSLLGHHQINNALTALLALQFLQPTLHTRCVKLVHIKTGLATVKWSGRLDMVSHNPFILLDGAHNSAGLQALINYLTQKDIPAPHSLIIGTKQDKQMDTEIIQLTELFPYVIVSQAKHQPTPADQLIRHIQPGAGYPNQKMSNTLSDITAIPDLKQAIKLSLQHLPVNRTLLITGSLYLVGDALSVLNRKKPSLNAMA